jgi:hypothetical protein
MTKQSFFRLLRLLKEDLKTNDIRAISSSGSAVTPLVKLAATIRSLVSGVLCALLFVCSSLFYYFVLVFAFLSSFIHCFIFILVLFIWIVIFLLFDFLLPMKAGGMYIDICGVFGLSQTSFFHPVHGPLWPTIHAIDIALAQHVVFKTDFSSCAKAAADFSHVRGLRTNIS